MPSYKLTYFDLMARGETIRLIFTFAGVEFEDDRIEYAKWPQIKPTTPSPSGQLPYLTIDGSKILCQSKTIARYVANEYGLAGNGNFEQALADMIVDCTEDITNPLVAGLLRETDESKKPEFRASYEKEKLPGLLANLEKILKQNNGGDGFFVGDKVTWADIAVMQLFHWMVTPMMSITIPLDDYPKLKAHKACMEAQPKLVKYLENRPSLVL